MNPSIFTMNLHYEGELMNDMSKTTINEINDAVKSYEVPYLKQLQEAIAAELVIREEQQVQDAVLACRKIAASVGIPLLELARHGEIKEKRKETVPVLAKYQHPDDKKLQWTGRGRTPNWVTQYVDKGGTLLALRIGG